MRRFVFRKLQGKHPRIRQRVKQRTECVFRRKDIVSLVRSKAIELSHTARIAIPASSVRCGMMMFRAFGTGASGRTGTYTLLSHIMLQAEKFPVMMMWQDGCHQHNHADKH